MMKSLVLTAFVLTLTACTTGEKSAPESVKTAAKKSESKPASSLQSKGRECICTKLWMPVCGENNKTYGNSCEADCAGVKYTEGACKDKLQDV